MRAIILALAIFAASPALAISADDCRTLRVGWSNAVTTIYLVSKATADAARRAILVYPRKADDLSAFQSALEGADAAKQRAFIETLNRICPK
ncbi:MAG TPA: hypothetical protein ENH55_05650 [Aurantimonas coralicida]|uniref:DUF5330 domain-containing protein n=2 Tax=root TaxID=1 RepID=A0A9C9NGR5_9HYPH|nr:hypothetical protein [Aurantimonas coralicida]HEU01257.1 hypothetical protein [Aurantimonas coralicida]